jgi:hypothetical protein
MGVRRVSPFEDWIKAHYLVLASDEPTPIRCSDYREATKLTTVASDRLGKFPEKLSNPPVQLR